MKRNITLIQLPAEKPDCCAICPLCGLIPRDMREYGSKETRICIGTGDAMTARATKVRASKKDSHHPLHRYCDSVWDSWMQIETRKLPVNTTRYNIFRFPYEQSLELRIKFHHK